MSTTITREQLAEAVSYCPETGVVTRRIAVGRWRAGSPVGHKRKDGYVVLNIQRQRLLAHRAAWILAVGEIPPGMEIDHINSDPSDNRLCNLRLASRAENCRNTTPRKNRSGFKGVSWHAEGRRWEARISSNGAGRHLGLFESASEAHAAYARAATELHGQFARTA